MDASALMMLVLNLITMLEFSATLTAAPVPSLVCQSAIRAAIAPSGFHSTGAHRRSAQIKHKLILEHQLILHSTVAQIRIDGRYERINLTKVRGVERVAAFGR